LDEEARPLQEGLLRVVVHQVFDSAVEGDARRNKGRSGAEPCTERTNRRGKSPDSAPRDCPPAQSSISRTIGAGAAVAFGRRRQAPVVAWCADGYEIPRHAIDGQLCA